jgi:hypothetical protein
LLDIGSTDNYVSIATIALQQRNKMFCAEMIKSRAASISQKTAAEDLGNCQRRQPYHMTTPIYMWQVCGDIGDNGLENYESPFLQP